MTCFSETQYPTQEVTSFSFFKPGFLIYVLINLELLSPGDAVNRHSSTGPSENKIGQQFYLFIGGREAAAVVALNRVVSVTLAW